MKVYISGPITNVDNFENFNNLQRSWATNKANTGYSTGMSHIATPKN